jgi:nitrite reductase/ring-hydroxylating ferredoxin subunit
VSPANDFVDVAPADRLPRGTALCFDVNETAIAVFNVDGNVFAVQDFCIGCGSSLAAGEVSGVLVTCSRCQWQYDVTTGCVNGVPSVRIDTFMAEIVDAHIIVSTTPDPLPSVVRSRRM